MKFWAFTCNSYSFLVSINQSLNTERFNKCLWFLIYAIFFFLRETITILVYGVFSNHGDQGTTTSDLHCIELYWKRRTKHFSSVTRCKHQPSLPGAATKFCRFYVVVLWLPWLLFLLASDLTVSFRVKVKNYLSDLYEIHTHCQGWPWECIDFFSDRFVNF